jgi:uncharacterized protein (DUF1697 family)
MKMQFLREVFETLGFNNVKTVLASGNVIFETESKDKKKLEQSIAKQLPNAIGFDTTVTLWRVNDLQKLFESEPFKNVENSVHTRLYATFIKQGTTSGSQLHLEGQGFRILQVWNGAVLSVVDLQSGKTTDLMQAVDKQFGKTATTRSWNTIERILKKAKIL